MVVDTDAAGFRGRCEGRLTWEVLELANGASGLIESGGTLNMVARPEATQVELSGAQPGALE